MKLQTKKDIGAAAFLLWGMTFAVLAMIGKYEAAFWVGAPVGAAFLLFVLFALWLAFSGRG